MIGPVLFILMIGGPDKMSSNLIPLPADYADWLTRLKQRIQGARQRALLAANNEQIRLYHDIGREIFGPPEPSGLGGQSHRTARR